MGGKYEKIIPLFISFILLLTYAGSINTIGKITDIDSNSNDDTPNEAHPASNLDDVHQLLLLPYCIIYIFYLSLIPSSAKAGCILENPSLKNKMNLGRPI